MTEPVFRRDGETFAPTGHARGPWDPGAQHGGAPAALAVGALEQVGGELRVVRLACDFLGPVPLVPLAVQAQITRPGRRFAVGEATVSAEGRAVLRVVAGLLRPAELPAEVATTGAQAPPGPGSGVPRPFADDRTDEASFHRTAMDVRFVAGDFGIGPGTAWFRLARPLVDEERPSRVQRVVAAADFGNGISRELDFASWLFVNTDLTVHLHRPPAGEWVCVDAETTIQPSGVGLAAARLFDERGALGLSMQTLYVRPRES